MAAVSKCTLAEPKPATLLATHSQNLYAIRAATRRHHAHHLLAATMVPPELVETHLVCLLVHFNAVTIGQRGEGRVWLMLIPENC